ncbi:uncharacterized protein LOC102393336 isoform X2 [Bubalus bubalis]|uniref:uncharacterized protein LOC102393336 isoform X2 n=1 Tax=Bubalus bubalis TaxID=89462 RepID=UPI000DBCAD83|nr:uncharacterized protein LOC102393336 isoform X2 [Bubalus bubalis]
MTCSCLEPEWQIHPAYWAQGWVTPQRLLLRDAWTTCGSPPHLRAEGSSVNDPAGQGGACSTSCPSASAVLAESCHFPSRSLLGLHVCFSLDPLRPPPLLALSVTAATSLPGFWITRLEFESAFCCRQETHCWIKDHLRTKENAEYALRTKEYHKRKGAMKRKKENQHTRLHPLECRDMNSIRGPGRSHMPWNSQASVPQL